MVYYYYFTIQPKLLDGFEYFFVLIHILVELRSIPSRQIKGFCGDYNL